MLVGWRRRLDRLLGLGEVAFGVGGASGGASAGVRGFRAKPVVVMDGDEEKNAAADLSAPCRCQMQESKSAYLPNTDTNPGHANTTAATARPLCLYTNGASWLFLY